MIFLIALQSVVAMADIHQSQNEHFSFEAHNTSHNPAYFFNDTSEDNIQKNLMAFDCDHCCHCHGGACVFVSKNKFESTLLFQLGKNTANYSLLYTSFKASPDNPPPIQS